MKDYTRSFPRLVSVLVLTLTLLCSFAYFAPGNSLRAVSAQSTSPNGSFGFLLNDSYFMRPNNNGGAILGVMNFDGAGSVTGSYTYQIGALRAQAAQTIAETFTGTYSSKPDGTGSVTLAGDPLPLTATYAMVIADGGQSLQLVMTNCAFGSNGCNFFATVNSGIARVAKAGSLNGSYGFQFNNSPVPTGTLGVMRFDGAGNVAMSSTSVGAGKDDTSGQAPVSSGTLTGTYSINPDGSGTINFPAAPGQSANSTYAFVITDGGSGLLVLRTDANPGANVSFGTARLQ
jgi:hypothetical protein